MAIGTAVQRGSSVYIYDEKNRLISSVSVGPGKNDGLVGFTSATVSVRRGSSVYMYNEKGQMTGSVTAR